MDSMYEDIAKLILDLKDSVSLTGAGVSAETVIYGKTINKVYIFQ